MNDNGIRLTTALPVKPIAEYARSAVHFSRFQLSRGEGDLEMSLELMEKVAGSNSEDADQAAELAKKIRAEMAALPRQTAGEFDPEGRLPVSSDRHLMGTTN